MKPSTTTPPAAEEPLGVQIGRRIQQLLDDRCMSQAELGKRLRWHGRPGVNMARLMKGYSVPKLELLHRVAQALGCRLRDILDPD